MCFKFIKMHVIYIYMCECSTVVALPDLLVAGDVTKLPWPCYEAQEE
jgi:hypothetical protein